MSTHKRLTFLIHPADQADTYKAVTECLMSAVREHPDTFDIVIAEPGVVDHVGYHDTTLSSVVFSREPNSQYHRLAIRPTLHPVFNDLLQIMVGEFA